MEIVAIDTFMQEKFPEEFLSNNLSKYWVSFHRGDDFIAGKFKSKGLKVYTLVWDIKHKSFYCNCSSQKNPCAHGIDLYFRYKHQYSEFKVEDSDSNQFSEQLAKAIPVNKKRSDYYTSEDLERMQASRTKQRTDRIVLMQAGSKILENWIEDVLSMGLADLSMKPISFWKDLASTLVNYKLNALSDKVLDFANKDRTKISNWYLDTIHFFSDLYIFASAFSKIDKLPETQESLLRGGGLKVMSKDLEKVEVSNSRCLLISIEQWHQNNLFFEKYLWLNIDNSEMIFVQNSTWEGAYDRKKELPFKENEMVVGQFVSYGYNQRYYLKEDYQKITDIGLELKIIPNSFDDIFAEFRTKFAQQLVLNEYYFVFKYAGIVIENGNYYLRDSKNKYIKISLSKKDYFKLKYDSKESTCMIIRLKEGCLALIAFFDGLNEVRSKIKKDLTA